MSLSTASRFARRELRSGLRQGLRGFRIFLACLAMGVAAIAAVGSVRTAIEAGLSRDGAILLGGDAEMEFTYRFAAEDEAQWMRDVAVKTSEVVDFRSMAVVQNGGEEERGLTQVKAVDANYPLVGAIGLSPEMTLNRALSGEDGLPGAVMEQILVDRLGLGLGDRFALGTQDFVLSAVLTSEPDSAAAGFGLGPRIIVRRSALEGSSLLSTGTLFNTKYRLQFAEGFDLDAIAADAKERFENSGMRWRDARNGAPGVAEFVDRLGAFLVLVGLSGLAVGGVGVFAAVQAYLTEKTSVIATLRTLGADQQTIFYTYFMQIGALSVAGITIGLVLGGLVPWALAPVIEASLPIPADFALYPEPLLEAAVYGALTAFIFTLWPLARAEDVRAATLFRDALNKSTWWPAPRYIAVTALALAALVGLAGYFSAALRLTLWTTGGIGIAMALLILAALGLRVLAGRAHHLTKGWPALRWALAAVTNPREGTTSVVLSLGLGLSVLAAVGQIDGTLRTAITGNLPDVAPSYFFVDIQKDQMPGYSARLAEDPSVSRVDSAPMLRGVITQINGKPAREITGDHWVLAGDRGVTYSQDLPARTKITEGSWWSPDYSGPPLISFAAEEAAEMNLSLGDTMTLNILGREITGTIASFREVDFSTAGIGFILSMNPGALSGAPHSFISTVYATPESEAQILRDLARAYPNITAIRVKDAIDRVADVLAGLAAATSYGALATLVTGFLVLIGAAGAGTGARIYEASVLKTLGASRAQILRSFALRAALLGLAAGLVAISAGILGGWAVAQFVMDTPYRVIWPSALGIVGGGISATLIAGLAFAWRPLIARPARALRNRD